MSGIPAHHPQAPSRFLGNFRSWLRSWSGDIWPSYEELPRATAAPSAPSCGSVSVLVVDDNPVNLMVMSALLQSRGVVPVLAADGAEAVALARESRFDLILMDLQMPVLDGWEATAAIRRFERACSRPAAPVISYSSMSLGAASLARHGMNGSLDKPCNDHALEECLLRWCPGYQPATTARGARVESNAWPAASRHAVSGAASPPRARA